MKMKDYQDEEPRYYCSECFGEIYQKENYYDFGDRIVCVECVNEAFRDGYDEWLEEQEDDERGNCEDTESY